MAPGRLRSDSDNSTSRVSAENVTSHDLSSDTPNARTQCKLTVFFPPPKEVGLDGKIGHVVIKLDPAPLLWSGIDAVLRLTTIRREKYPDGRDVTYSDGSEDDDGPFAETPLLAEEWKAHKKIPDQHSCPSTSPCVLNQDLLEPPNWPLRTGYNSHPLYFIFQDVQMVNLQDFPFHPIKMEFTVYVEGCLEEELDEENPSTIPVPCETAPLVYTNQKAEVTKEERECKFLTP